MDSGIPSSLRRVYNQIRADVRSDPFLSMILLLAAVLAGFGIWYRVPNFAGPDEYSRLVQPMKAAGYVAADPGFESLRAGIMDGRALGATFYLYGLVLVPVFVVVLLSGGLGDFVALGGLESRWDLWHAAPEWFWTSSILLGRAVNVVLAVGCVYLMYRIGSRTRSRQTGRYAAILLTLSLGFLAASHELAEDVPMLFFFLCTLCMAIRYTDTGETRDLVYGSVFGGLAIAFKLTGGVAGIILGVALAVRTYRDGDGYRSLLKPKLYALSLSIGLLTVYVGIPSVLVGGPDVLVTRLTHSTTRKTSALQSTPPISYWMTLQYINALGAPLFAACIAGTLATVYRAVSIRSVATNEALLLVGLAAYFAVFSQWQFIRMHHLLPTIPLFILLLAPNVVRLRNDRGSLGRVLVGFLLVSTALFAAAGDATYVMDSRDAATSWMETTVAEDESVVVYENSVADVAAVHGQATTHYEYQENDATYSSTLVLNDSAYTEWMVTTPDRGPEYIQLTSDELRYLDPQSAKSHQYPRRAEYVDTLVNGDEYSYSTAREFGDRPATTASPEERLLRAAFSPDVPQREPYVLVLERTDDSR